MASAVVCVTLPACLRSPGAHVVRLSFFFFSSRRRHTRCLSDWSSDVCSSDLTLIFIDVHLFDIRWVMRLELLIPGSTSRLAVVEKHVMHVPRLLWVVVGGRSFPNDLAETITRTKDLIQDLSHVALNERAYMYVGTAVLRQ